MNLTAQLASRAGGGAHVAPHGREHYRQERVQLQRRRVTAPQMWRMDQETPAFDPTYDVVRTHGDKHPLT